MMVMIIMVLLQHTKTAKPPMYQQMSSILQIQKSQLVNLHVLYEQKYAVETTTFMQSKVHSEWKHTVINVHVVRNVI